MKATELKSVLSDLANLFRAGTEKAAAIDEIERRFAELVYDDNSHKQAASTTPW